MFCLKNDCNRAINVVSEGSDTRHWIECPVHGAIGSFENFAEYEQTLRNFVNRVVTEKGLQGISPGASVRIQ
jgi:hypothetical protein